MPLSPPSAAPAGSWSEKIRCHTRGNQEESRTGDQNDTSFHSHHHVDHTVSLHPRYRIPRSRLSTHNSNNNSFVFLFSSYDHSKT